MSEEESSCESAAVFVDFVVYIFGLRVGVFNVGEYRLCCLLHTSFLVAVVVCLLRGVLGGGMVCDLFLSSSLCAFYRRVWCVAR